MQDRNAEMVENLVQDFTTRGEFAQSSARIADSMMWLNRDGGGSLIWAFDAQGPACYGRGSTSQWGELNIDISNYAAVIGRGGPYVTLNGTNETLSIGDAPWQETGAFNLLVWAWCYPITLSGADYAIAAKWNGPTNDRSWLLRWQNTASAFQFVTNNTGLVGASTTISSTYAEAVNNWHFVAGYFEPSTLMRAYVAQSTDGSLTIDSLTAGVPPLLHDGNAALSIGATGTPNQHFVGSIGVAIGRANVPATNINSHVTRLFQATRWFYGG